MDRKHNKSIVPAAKASRKNMTSEEKHLWYDYLHDHPARFTKQKVLGNYIADFYSAQAKLVIEIDGSQHYTLDGIKYDAERTEYLKQYGLTVLRFTNAEVNKKFSDVCKYIDRYVENILGSEVKKD